MNTVLHRLRSATAGSRYEGALYIVGGYVRDRLLGIPPGEDLDIVLEGDAALLADFLFQTGIAEHPPVVYRRFGTAMVTVEGRQVELVGARKESYAPVSRKPRTVPGTLVDDILRRDFTVNTLLENLHTGQTMDLTGMGLADLESGIIRTPGEPGVTFADDPLRMLRAIRFAARLGFVIAPETWAAIGERSDRIAIVSPERIREEFVKIVMGPGVGLDLLADSGLLARIAPELDATRGIEQNAYHIHDVWTHSVKTLESIPAEKGIIPRLAALLHDIGKPATRSIDSNGDAHFFKHDSEGAALARKMLQRMRFSGAQISEIAFLISMHLRVGEYQDQWTDAAVRRLIRDAGEKLEDLILLTQADRAASNTELCVFDAAKLRERVERVTRELGGRRVVSPLSGREIMSLLGVRQGPEIGEIKAFLENEVTEGRLMAGDKASARETALKRYKPGG